MTQANKSQEHQFGKSDLLKSIPINIAGTIRFFRILIKYVLSFYLFKFIYLLSKMQ